MRVASRPEAVERTNAEVVSRVGGQALHPVLSRGSEEVAEYRIFLVVCALPRDYSKRVSCALDEGLADGFKVFGGLSRCEIDIGRNIDTCRHFSMTIDALEHEDTVKPSLRQ